MMIRVFHGSGSRTNCKGHLNSSLFLIRKLCLLEYNLKYLTLLQLVKIYFAVFIVEKSLRQMLCNGTVKLSGLLNSKLVPFSLRLNVCIFIQTTNPMSKSFYIIIQDYTLNLLFQKSKLRDRLLYSNCNVTMKVKR